MQDVFFPYRPNVSHSMEVALERTVRAAAASGFPIKVAIIGTPIELGLVQSMFGHPQSYAQFLDREISFNQRRQLLVVMPGGFGVVPASLARALSRVPIYAQQRTYGLTRSAILAVVALARARGRPIATPAIPAYSTGGGGTPALVIFGVPAALLIFAGLVAMRGGWARRSKEGSES